MKLRSLAASVCLALAMPAGATEIALVGAHDAELSLDDSRTRMAAIAAGIDKLKDFDALTPDAVAARVSGREDVVLGEVFNAGGVGLLSDGRSLYMQAQPEDALSLVEAAIEEFEASLPWTRDVQPLWDASSLLAAVRMAVGDEEGAREAVRQAITLLPSRLPDPAVVPPPVVSMFEEERSSLLADRVTLSVKGSGLQSVWIDGGLLPDGVLSAPVPEGTHHLHGLSRDGNVAYATLSVDGDMTVQLDMEYPSLGRRAVSEVRRSTDVRELYLSLGRVLRSDLVLVMGETEGGTQLQLHAPDVGAFGDPVTLATGSSDKEVTSAVVAMLKALPEDGTLSTVTFTALPVSVPDNRLLSSMLLAPATAAAEVPLPVTRTPTTPPVRSGAKKPIWPVAVGVGAGVAVATAVTLGVVLGGNGPGSGGTVIFGGQP